VPLRRCGCTGTNGEDPAGKDAVREATCEGTEWNGLPRHEFCRGVELLEHSFEGRSYGCRSRVAAAGFVQSKKDQIVGEIHVDSALKLARARGLPLSPAPT